MDTNVYVFGRIQPRSNSRIILDLAEAGALTVVLSDTLLLELRAVFGRLFGRRAGLFARYYAASLPSTRWIREDELTKAKDELGRYAKAEDLDHLVAARIAQVDALVTTDSDLLQSDVHKVVPIMTPKRLLQSLGLRSYATEHEE